MPLPHHPSPAAIAAWPSFTDDAPLRLLVSGCLSGMPCGVDGTSYYLRGPGVAGAAVMRAGVPVVSQRDERTLAAVLEKLGALAGAPFTDSLDHHEREWYRTYFAEPLART